MVPENGKRATGTVPARPSGSMLKRRTPIAVVGYDSTRLLKPWIPQAPSRIVNTMSPP